MAVVYPRRLWTKEDTVISGDFVVTEKHLRNDENGSRTDHSEPTDEYDADGLVDRVDSGNATADELRKEQRGDETLKTSLERTW